MNTVLENDRSVVLHNISWKSYQTISDTLQDETPAHFTYDRGRLEIMVLSLKHESVKRLLAALFERLAERLELDFLAAGSTTFRREELARGFEPDECYYVEHAPMMRGKDTVNLDFDPPPDITIEVDVTNSSIDRMGIFAAVGIPEVWRCENNNVLIYLLQDDGTYAMSEISRVIPSVNSRSITGLLRIGLDKPRQEFWRQIDEFAATIRKSSL